MMHVSCSKVRMIFLTRQKQISISDFYILWIIIITMGLLQRNIIMKKMCEAGILRKDIFFQIGSFLSLVDWFLSLFAFLSNHPVTGIHWQFHLLNKKLKMDKSAQDDKINIAFWTEEISERYMSFIQPGCLKLLF